MNNSRCSWDPAVSRRRTPAQMATMLELAFGLAAPPGTYENAQRFIVATRQSASVPKGVIDKALPPVAEYAIES